MLGCVDNIFLNREFFFLTSKGLSIHIAATVCFFIDSITESCDIFLSAEIIAFLSFVSSTLQASARYSLFLEIASLIIGNIKYQTVIRIIHKDISNKCVVSLSLSLSFSFSFIPFTQTLKNVSQIVPIMPIKRTITTINNVSLFII